MKYIVIMEDGQFYKADSVGDDEFNGVASGVCSVLNIRDGTFYSEGDWYSIPVWGEKH